MRARSVEALSGSSSPTGALGSPMRQSHVEWPAQAEGHREHLAEAGIKPDEKPSSSNKPAARALAAGRSRELLFSKTGTTRVGLVQAAVAQAAGDHSGCVIPLTLPNVGDSLIHIAFLNAGRGTDLEYRRPALHLGRAEQSLDQLV